MRVYVETNFILEAAYQQEQHQATTELFDMAGTGQVELACPVFAVAEALGNLDRRRARRNGVRRAVSAEVRDMARSDPQRALAGEMGSLVERFASVNEAESDRLGDVISRVIRAATMLPLDAATDDAAHGYAEAFDLSVQDALVLATVVADLDRRPVNGPTIFVSRDSAAYSAPNVRAELQRHGCVYLSHFAAALERLRAAGNDRT